MVIRYPKKIFSILFLVSLFLCLYSFLGGCGRERTERHSEETVRIPVRAQRVKKGDVKASLFYVGDIKAQDEVQVYPKVTGKLIEYTIKEGAKVDKDTAIAFIDRDEVGYEFEKAPVKSPIAGIVGRIFLDKGSSVTVKTSIAEVVDMDAVKVRVHVVERDLPQIREGQKATVKVDAYADEIFKGVVDRVSPIVNLASRTAQIEIRVPNPDHKLKPGMFAKIWVTVQTKKDTLKISRDAIVRESSKVYVFSIEDGVAHKKPVKIGLSEDNILEVIAGLSEGDIGNV